MIGDVFAGALDGLMAVLVVAAALLLVFGLVGLMLQPAFWIVMGVLASVCGIVILVRRQKRR